MKNMIQVSNTQPTHAANKIWIDNSAENQVQVPSYQEFGILKDDIAK